MAALASMGPPPQLVLESRSWHLGAIVQSQRHWVGGRRGGHGQHDWLDRGGDQHSGFAIDASELATSGNTAGMVAKIYSPGGIGALILNNASGPITGALISARTSKGVQFTVDGKGNVNAAGVYTGNGTGLTGIQFSQLVGQLPSTQFSGSYGQAVTLSNRSNVFYGDGSHLIGVGSGSPYYIQNGTSQQANANFNISGSGTVGGTLAGNAVNATTNYQIGGGTVLATGYESYHADLFLGVGAGNSSLGAPVYNDTFTGYQAGYNNTGNELEPILGSGNSFYGVQAGYSNSYGWDDTFVGLGAGYGNTNGYMNTYVGSRAGLNNTNGFYNTFLGWHAGSNSTTGTSDIYIGNSGPSTGTEGYTIRIGFPYTEEDEDCLPCPDCEILPCGQNTTYIAGIYGSTVGGSGIAVYVDNNGQLGTVVSSLRFKEQVRDMGDSTNALMKLRPVTFF